MRAPASSTGPDAAPFAEVRRNSFTSKTAFSGGAWIRQQSADRRATMFVEFMLGHKIVGADVSGPGELCAEAPWGLAAGLWLGGLHSQAACTARPAGGGSASACATTSSGMVIQGHPHTLEVTLYFNVSRADREPAAGHVARGGRRGELRRPASAPWSYRLDSGDILQFIFRLEYNSLEFKAYIGAGRDRDVKSLQPRR